jgi:hypothetical protein
VATGAPYNPPTTVTTSTAVFRGTSGRSLAYGVSVGPGLSNYRTGVEITFCSNSYVDLAGRTVSAWVYITGPALPACGGAEHDFSTRVHGSGGDGTVGSATPVLNSWFFVSGTVTSTTFANAYRVRFSLYINCVDPTWTGTVYLDDITIGG